MEKLKYTSVIILTLTCIAVSSLSCLVYGIPGKEISATGVEPASIPVPSPPSAPVQKSTTVSGDKFVNIDPNQLSYNPTTILQGKNPFNNGEISYAGYSLGNLVKAKSTWSPYLFVQTLKKGEVNKRIIAPVNTPFYYIFDPLISPNGEYVAFGYGWPYDSSGRFQECIWDLEKNKYLKPIQRSVSDDDKYLSYRKLFWSPSSRCIAYIRGGDQEGSNQNFQPLRLYIRNIVTENETYIASNPYLTHMAWTPQNTLLYGTIPEDEIADISPRQAKIHEVSADGSSSKVLIDGGFDPRPSPDGKYIVYFGWPPDNPATKAEKTDKKDSHQVSQAQIGLYLFERSTGKKTLLLSPVSHFTFLDMLWKPDNSGIIFLKYLSRSPHAQIQVSEIGKNTGATKVIKVLTVDDYTELPRVSTEPQIRSLLITNDNKYLIYVKTAYTGEKDNKLTGTVSLDALNLIDGSIVKGAETTSFMGLDYLPTQ